MPNLNEQSTPETVSRSKTHGMLYTPVATSVFHGIEAVVISAWSLEGPQPLLMNYALCVAYRATMAKFGQKITIVPADKAQAAAKVMQEFVGRKMLRGNNS